MRWLWDRLWRGPRALFRRLRLQRLTRAYDRLSQDQDLRTAELIGARLPALSRIALLSRRALAQVAPTGRQDGRAAGGSEISAALATEVEKFKWQSFGSALADRLVARTLQADDEQQALRGALAVAHAFRRGSPAPLRSLPAVTVAAARGQLLDDVAFCAYVEYLATHDPDPARTLVEQALRKACNANRVDAGARNEVVWDVCAAPFARTNLGHLALQRDDHGEAARLLKDADREAPVLAGLARLGVGVWTEVDQCLALLAPGAPALQELRWLRDVLWFDHELLGGRGGDVAAATAQLQLLLADGERLGDAATAGAGAWIRAQRTSLRRRLSGSGAVAQGLLPLSGNAGLGARPLHTELCVVASEQGARVVPPRPGDGGTPALAAELGWWRWRASLGQLAQLEHHLARRGADAGAATALLAFDLDLRLRRLDGLDATTLRSTHDPTLVTYASELLLRYRLELGEHDLVTADLAGSAALLLSPAMRATLRAQAAIQAGDWSAALAACDQALTLAPRCSANWSTCGFTYLASGLDEHAALCFGVALERDPGNVYAQCIRPRAAAGGATLDQQLLQPTVTAALRRAGRMDLVAQAQP